MASSQQAFSDADETFAQYMQRRSQDLARRNQAQQAGLVLALRDRRPAAPNPMAPQAPAGFRPAGATSQGEVVRFDPRGTRYGQLYAPPPVDIERFRREQTEFDKMRRDIARRNMPLAIATLAMPALAGIAEAGAEIAATRAAIAAARAGASKAYEIKQWNYTKHEDWPETRALRIIRNGRIRAQGRKAYKRAYGIDASEMGAEVHHSDPLQWMNLTPKLDVNRVSNLQALPKAKHAILTKEWAKFSRALDWRYPTLAEKMAAKLRIDRMGEPFIVRPGVARPRLPPKPPPKPKKPR